MSIIERAKTELVTINFGAEDSAVMVEILEKFFDQWDSGGAVSCAAPVLQRLIAGKPLGPLTGADSEWFIHDMDDRCYAQNIRCSTVFKHRNGKCYDIDARDPNAEIAFPYWPDRAEVREPVIEIDTAV
jgi:hypothetical protein